MIRKALSLVKKQFRAEGTSQEIEIKRFGASVYPLPEADKWGLSEFVIQRLIPIVGVRPYPLDELLLMCSTISYFQPDFIVEWGTHYGASARVFFEVVHFLSLRAEIHSVDLPLEVEHVENIKNEAARGVLVKGLPVHLHIGDGLTVAKALIEENQPTTPLFFLDGDHEYETVQRELRSIKQFAPRAIILAHDTFYQDQTSQYNVGPYKAVNEFVEQNSLSVNSTVLGLPGMSLLHW